MEYLFIELGIFLAIFLMHKLSKVQLFKNKLQMFWTYFTAIIVGVLWDNYAVWRGHWSYSGEGTLGIFLGYIPLKDYFFIILVTYAIIVGYKFYEKILKNKK